MANIRNADVDYDNIDKPDTVDEEWIVVRAEERQMK